MTRKAFTLIELLVVIAIMGLMGTITVGGYRAMRRGMEDRGVMQNVNQFIRSAYQRAQIDRLPVSVYFWNETLSDAKNADEVPVVVGRAVAVRRSGRITKVNGSYLFDEFGDLSFNRLVLDEDTDQEGICISGEDVEGEGLYLYRLQGDEGSSPKRSVIATSTSKETLNEPCLVSGVQFSMPCYAFYVVDAGGVNWKAGDAYGFEFAELTLPHGYIFGSTYSRSTSSPVAGEDAIRFRVGSNSGSGAAQGTDGRDTITISNLRPDKSGSVSAQSVATSESPTKNLD